MQNIARYILHADVCGIVQTSRDFVMMLLKNVEITDKSLNDRESYGVVTNMNMLSLETMG